MASSSCHKTFNRLEDTLEKYIPCNELKKIKQLLYGEKTKSIQFDEKLVALSKTQNVELRGFKFACAKEQTRVARIIRVGLIQHQIVLPVTAPILNQQNAIHQRVSEIIEIAAQAQVNILCLPEFWTMPYVFCTQEKHPWVEFAENAENGPSVEMLRKLALKFGMVIISPIFERDEKGQKLWIISESGKVMGKTRKNHIPRIKDFNEAAYFGEGTLGHPVYDTTFGKIAVNICYERHHPQSWLMYGLNGAELVFNPSANTGDDSSEQSWLVEARAAAIANSYYTFPVNRVGTEMIPLKNGSLKSFGYYHGSSYSVAPDGSRTPGLSRVNEGLHITELDLNLCRQVADSSNHKANQRLDMYGQKFLDASLTDFKQQIVYEI
ncbi:Beta-ureidopropionase [Tyrophagus putrescentiae]|nr:Beta-ureidopropionase [Tyrophagus putrescentiae]